MIHQQIINSPFQFHLGFMEPDSTTFPPHLGSSFATHNLMTSLIDHHQDNNNNNNFSCTKEMLHNNPSPMEAMREMMFRIAAMQPVRIDPDSVKPRKRRNVRISNDPQSVAARHRRERISERIRILQRLVPGGTKMDTASMLDEAVRYLKFLKREVKSLEEMAVSPLGPPANCVATSTRSSWGFRVPYSIMHSNVVGEGM